MGLFNDKISRFIEGLNGKTFSEKYEDVLNLIDAVLDGDYDFYLSSFEEYTPDEDEYLLEPLNYDAYTKKCIYRFAVEFEELFPNIISKEEIVRRISNNLSTNIMFEDLSSDGIDDDIPICGYYNPRTKRIYIDNNLTSSKVDSVLFHEFLHCITIKDTIDDDLESEFLTETGVSLMQDRFERLKYNSKERCNNYIISFIKQFEIVLGDDLYKEYVQNFRDISNCFEDYPVKEYSNKTILHNYILLFNTMNKIIKNGGDEYLLKYANAIYEFNVALFLGYHLKNSKLSKYEKLEKIDQLLNIQKTPDIDLYKSLINDNCKDDEILNEFPNLRYVIDGEKTGKIDVLLEDKINHYEAAKKCGFTKIMDYKDNHMFVKDNVFFSYPSSYYKEYLKEENYYYVMYMMEKEKNLNLSNYDLDEVYREFQNNSSSLREEMKEGYDYNNDKLANYRKRNSPKHDFMFKAKLEDQELFIEQEDELKVYTKKDIVSLFDGNNNSDANKILVTLLRDGINSVYTAENSRKLIAEKDNCVYIYSYKPNKKTYDFTYYESVDTQHRKSNSLKKKL